MRADNIKQAQTFSVLAQDYDSVEEAEEIVSQDEDGRLLRRMPALEQLFYIKENCSKPDWDGRNAVPVSTVSFRNALIFLIKYPDDLFCPSPGVSVNGQVTLEWRRRDGRLLSLAFDDKDQVTFILFLRDGEKLWGEQSALLGYTDIFVNFLKEIVL